MNEDLLLYLELSKKIAQDAGKILQEAQEKGFSVKYKGDHDLVTEVDKKSEQFITKALLKAHPSHSILGEEGVQDQTQDVGHRWIIDPIDGTTNFTHGHPFYCISIGLEVDGEIQVGTVLAPALNQLFYAAKGHGAFLNDKKISVSKVDNISQSLLGTGFNPSNPTTAAANVEHFRHFQKRCDGIRRCGAAALDLCYTAAGYYDGFWEPTLKPWDMAAGKIIVEEAGGTVTALNGDDFNINEQNILANNGLVHKEMVEYFQSIG